MPTGGDGTFLEVSSKVKGGSRIPIIGINTDPERSAGHLCLRFASCDGKPRGLEEVVQRLLIGQFKWLKRNRIQITVVYSDIDKRILPDLALNDVLFVENNPSKTCYYEIEVCGLRDRSGRQIINIKEKQKSSGFLVSTGTGSSAWLFNTKKLWKDDVSELIKIVERRANVDLSHLSVGDITDEYNESIVYPPDDPRMKFGVRELINSGIFRGHVHKGYAHKIIIKSRSEARLVIDGARSHQLHPGTSAIFEIVPSQAVHTVSF
ncbi:hypothetical protein Zmor_011875 [Zophobas morio]|jgi:NAD+ kinase|uniref:NAD(+) kinase n=1 Tax=Zophobas morio TaxID=2755281 RepID=A0AA38HJI7_9CUCU|nr:hypothetical protein Zmor_011875 [Zophobas morio]